MMDTVTLIDHLASIVGDFGADDPPEGVTDKTRLCLLDHLAALLHGRRSEMEPVATAMLPAFGEGPCAIIASDRRTSSIGAAYLHGLLATAEDLDDSHRFASGLHLGAVSYPPLLALAATHDLSGARLLAAAACGYEIASRISRAADSGIRARGFHATGVIGPFGAAAAAALALGLDRQRTANAFGIAASSAGGIFAFLGEGSSVRHQHGAAAAANGLAASLLAQGGMTGPRRALEGKDGFMSAYAHAHDPAFILAASPRESGAFEILNVYHKLYACCGHAYPALTGALALRHDVPAEAIARIEARLYKASAALTNYDPASVAEAKFSLPFILAIAWTHGAISEREMTMETVHDPRIRDLASRVFMVEDPGIAARFPAARSARLIIETKCGARRDISVDAPLGMPENPVGFPEIGEKFMNAAAPLMHAERASEIMACVRALGAGAQARDLVRLLAGA